MRALDNPQGKRHSYATNRIFRSRPPFRDAYRFRIARRGRLRVYPVTAEERRGRQRLSLGPISRL